MDNQTKTPIDLLTEALAEMTKRAMEAERQRDAAKEDATNWFQISQHKDAQLKETEAKLAAETEELQRVRRQFKEVIDRHKKKGES